MPGFSGVTPTGLPPAPPPETDAPHLLSVEKEPAQSDGTSQFIKKKVAPQCRIIVKNRYFQAAMFLALLCALFLPDMWVIINRPNNSDLDVLLTVVLAMFLFELLVQSIGLSKSYLKSFFFWMDMLGAMSLLLDLAYISSSDQSVSGNDEVADNVIIMRAARIAKLGARAGRFTKLVKLLRFLPGVRKNADDGTAKVISARLITALSTRTSCLIILLVMIMPLFSMWTYPEEDWSRNSYVEILERAYENRPATLIWQLGELAAFYEDKSYYPWRVSLKSLASLPSDVSQQFPWISEKGAPLRLSNNMVYESDFFKVEFNLQSPNQIDALMNIMLLVVVMVLMVSFSLVLSNSVSAIVLRPLEQLLTQVRTMASTIFQSVTDMAVVMKEEAEDQDDEEEESEEEGSKGKAFGNETELLAKVVQKLAVISEITMHKPVVDTETLQGLGEGDRAVIHGFQGTASAAEAELPDEDEEEEPDNERFENMFIAQRAMVENAGLSMDLIDSWSLNPLELDRARNHAAVMYFAGPHNHGIEFDPVLMGNFLQEAELGYVKYAPYHNWFHAVDCTHAVYRLLQLCSAEAYLSKEERYALIVSAISHDLGHPGLNNTFLIETGHELALLYNDKSPLENMHCARLFEIVGQARCNVFASLTKAQYYDVRKVCIDAILHTDNAQHFTMVKEVQMLYEVNSEMFDASREIFLMNEPGEHILIQEAVECFRLPESRKLMVNLFLHMADISNCTKPFRISRIWSWQILEEFFMQGEAEAKLGVPVQALNDRNRVNRPFSQVGFIEFLVSPLMFIAMKVLPQTEHLAVQMLQNARTWQKHWETEHKDPPSDVDRRMLSDRIVKLEHRYRSLTNT
mmetsp:Transcript_59040/g.104933  ORF Transcript_59040/g.104933 Transcript_59040/m.104933 type:complete len:858 (-) Transcript_59040:75-2648(-)